MPLTYGAWLLEAAAAQPGRPQKTMVCPTQEQLDSAGTSSGKAALGYAGRTGGAGVKQAISCYTILPSRSAIDSSTTARTCGVACRPQVDEDLVVTPAMRPVHPRSAVPPDCRTSMPSESPNRCSRWPSGARCRLPPQSDPTADPAASQGRQADGTRWWRADSSTPTRLRRAHIRHSRYRVNGCRLQAVRREVRRAKPRNALAGHRADIATRTERRRVRIQVGFRVAHQIGLLQLVTIQKSKMGIASGLSISRARAGSTQTVKGASRYKPE